jgi:thiol-disulfide isomerase/thioredoxin
MRKKTVLALLLMISMIVAMSGCGGGGSSESSGSGTQSAQTAGSGISFKTTDLEGNAVDSKELFAKNKVTMINIWGTYCGPCVEEMPELEQMSKEYADKGAAIVGLVVDVTEADDSKLAEAKSIVKDTGVTYVNLKAWDGFKDQLAAPGTPTTYFVDSNGNLIGDPVVGANVMKYRQTLDELLAK